MHLRLPPEALLWRGEHEPEVQNAILAKVGPGAVVYDIGAHVGSMALGAALLVGDLGLVVAFDGDPENIARLEEHCTRNGLESRLCVVHAAVWSRTAIDGIGFRRGAIVRSQGGVQADGNRPVLGSGEVINVTAVSLDDFIGAGVPPPHLVKIDVEGGEYEILHGGKKLFAKQRPLVIAEVHHQKAAEQITNWLRDTNTARSGTYQKNNFPGISLPGPKRQMERPGCGLAARDRSLRRLEGLNSYFSCGAAPILRYAAAARVDQQVGPSTQHV